MRISKIKLINFGPFKNYKVTFASEEDAFVLLTGRNNEGKSNLIFALKLIHYSCKVIGKKRQEFFLNDDTFYKLLLSDTQGINIGRMIHNYDADKAIIECTFDNGFQITSFLDSKEDIIYADYIGRIPRDIETIFGFMPPLDPLAEQEEVLTKKSYILQSLNTSLAPRHLRNQLYQLLSDKEFQLVKAIIKNSWKDIELSNYSLNLNENTINCFFKEKNFTREICWAGQGLQIWFQIISNLVRLRSFKIIILDEPEVFLHPEKQNDLINILREYHDGGVIIATHSIELMNNVNVSHIINVQKNQKEPKLKSARDLNYLEFIRSQVGSNFNFHASQFEETDKLIFTESQTDYKILNRFAEEYNYSLNTKNIPIEGFNEYLKTIPYKEAYKLLIGKEIACCLVLDRDYYPEKYLEDIIKRLKKENIKVIYTPGKEIENLYLNEEFLKSLISNSKYEQLKLFIDELYRKYYTQAQATFISLHKKCLPRDLDVKTIIETYKPLLDQKWDDPQNRYLIAPGKVFLKELKRFFKTEYEITLSGSFLVKSLAKFSDNTIAYFIKSIYSR